MEHLKISPCKNEPSDEESRRAAVSSLSHHPFEEIRHALAVAMGDESWRVRKEAVDLLLNIPFTPEIAEFLVQMLRSQDNAGLRNAAVESLQRIGRVAIPTLSHYIVDPDQDVRKFIIDVLGDIADPVVVPKLVGALADEDRNVSAAAAENLGKIGDPAAVPYLVESLNIENIWLCHAVLGALKNIGVPVPVSVVSPLASVPFLRKGAYDCLGVVGDADAVPLLLQGLKEKAKSTRESAVVALANVGRRVTGPGELEDFHRALREYKDTDVVENLAGSLNSQDRKVQDAVVYVLGVIGDERAVLPLLHCCRDEFLRRQSIAAIGGMGEAGMRQLVASYNGADEEEQCLITYVWGELSRREAAPQLQEGMISGSPLLRKVAVLAAGKIKLVSLIDDIARLLTDPDHDVRESAIHVLAQLALVDGDEIIRIAQGFAHSDVAEMRRTASILYAAVRDVEKLARFLKDEDPAVRKSAVLSLSELKDRSSAGTLVMALADEDADVRIAAATALGAIGEAEHCDALLLALNDEDMWVQSAAIKSLTNFDAGRVIPALEHKFNQAEGMVLVSLLEAFAEIGSERSWKLVADSLNNTDPDVVKAALVVLERDGTEWIERHASMLILHSHWDVRSTFARIAVAKLGSSAVPILKTALSTETDDLVKAQIAELLGGFE